MGALPYVALWLAGLGIAMRLIQDHILANRYRALVREAERLKQAKPPPAPAAKHEGVTQWRAVYKDGRSQHEVIIEADAKGEAVRKLFGMNIKMESVVSLEPV